MRELVIAGHRIADDTSAWVCAELGTNHGGSVETAKRLIEAAAWAGCDAVKLQKRDNRTLFTRAMYEAPYTSEHAFGATYGEHREALELSWGDYVVLNNYAHGQGLAFGVTAFDEPSGGGLWAHLGPMMDFCKIASGCLTDTALIEQCARFWPVLISTGGGTLTDVYRAAAACGPNLAMLQCTASYPCPPTDLNLRVIDLFRSELSCVVGLSDHQDGWSLAPAAYALGARIFEKHFTLDHNAKGSDHRFSLEPEGMRAMVRALRATHEAMGDGIKRRLPSEESALYKMEKSVVAARTILMGVPIVREDLAVKSPGGGLKPYQLPDVIGRCLVRPWAEDEPIPSLDAELLWT